MPTKVFHYPKCSTCRKATQWLQAHKEDVVLTDLVLAPPTVAQLRDLHRRSGLPLHKLFNTAGQSYREGNFKQRLAGMSEAEALAALAADGKLIKRPIVDTGKHVLVGFAEPAYRKVFASGGAID